MNSKNLSRLIEIKESGCNNAEIGKTYMNKDFDGIEKNAKSKINFIQELCWKLKKGNVGNLQSN